MTNIEIWKDIPNYEGLYQVSNLGRVKRLISFKCLKERILKPGNNGTGYLQVSLCKGSNKKYHTIHKLMAISFLNHTSDDGFVVDHIDGNRSNNVLSNLNLITQHQNIIKRKLRRSPITSVNKGVSFHSRDKKWRAMYYCPKTGKQISLGYFSNEYEATKSINNYERSI